MTEAFSATTSWYGGLVDNLEVTLDVEQVIVFYL